MDLWFLSSLLCKMSELWSTGFMLSHYFLLFGGLSFMKASKLNQVWHTWTVYAACSSINISYTLIINISYTLTFFLWIMVCGISMHGFDF